MHQQLEAGLGRPTGNYVVTGASSGIGLAATTALVEQGFRVFACVRKAEDGARLIANLGDNLIPLRFDVTDEAGAAQAAKDVLAAVGEQGILGLVNSAGISISGPLADIKAELMQRHFNVNVMGVLHTVQAFLPLLKISRDRWGKPGRIVNISALSGRNAYPFMGPYAASKHALEALSDSLRRELLIYGVDVIVIQPGNIATPMWEKSRGISTDYSHTDYAPILKHIDTVTIGKHALPVSKTTDRIIKALTKRRPRARYVIPDDWIRFWIAPRLLPDRVFDFFVDRHLNLAAIRKKLARPDG